MAKSAVTAERFAKGMTFDEYVTYAGSPQNLAREAFGSYYPDGGAMGIPRKEGPANVLVISEDWSSDCRRDVPVLARLAEAGGLALRIFNRDGQKILGQRRPDPAAYPDGNHGLMIELLNAKDGAEWASVPAVGVYTKDFQELCRYLEYPAIYHKDRVRGHQQAARGGESAEQARDRGMKEFAAMQASPFFDLWASAGIDEILSAIYEKRVVSS